MEAAGPRRIVLHRRVATVEPGRIDVRPGREVMAGPLIGVGIGVVCFVAIVLFRDTFPLFLLAVLLLFAVVLIPLAGMGLIYSIIGTNIVVDARKNSAVFHQGLVGLGIGTREVVPFEKIVEFVVEEAGEDEADGPPAEELTQWQVTLVKTSGRRLRIAGVTVLRFDELAALEPVTELARALAALTDRPLVLPEVEEAIGEPA